MGGGLQLCFNAVHLSTILTYVTEAFCDFPVGDLGVAYVQTAALRCCCTQAQWRFHG